LLRKTNGGQASAFNLGIPECRGEIIALLDGDDWWAPGKLKRVVETMTADPTIGMVGHAIVESFEDGTENAVALKEAERLRLSTVHAARVFRLHRAYLGTSRLTLRASIARNILPVPEELVVEADEYLFTLAGFLADFVILKDALTHYRIHGGNLFVGADIKSGGLHRKQRVLEALYAALCRDLPTRGAPNDVVDCLMEIVGAEATQLRLMLQGGAPWETFLTERTIFRIQHGDASWKQNLFRHVTTFPALLLPPRWFYAARRWIAGQSWYATGRKQFLPVPGFTEIEAPRHIHE
jgi:glycosyltransferase involved in cell wall biosynthesis